MNEDNKRLYQRLLTLIDKRRLREAINEIKGSAQKHGEMRVFDKASQIEENYRYMLMYLAQGVDDPQRNDLYDDIVLTLYTLLDLLMLHIENSQYRPTLYYSNYTYMRSHPEDASLSAMLTLHAKLSADLSLFSLVMNQHDNTDAQSRRRRLEDTQSGIFMRLWYIPQLTKEDAEAVRQTLESESVTGAVKQHLISGITMGMLQQYDKRRLELLMLAYLNNPDMKVSSAALVGMLLGLWKYRNRPLSRKLRDVLMSVKDKLTWGRDLQLAYIEIIRARDTERINRKMYDEVIPRMQKLRPDIMDKINKGSIDPEDPMSIQENPEWQDMLEKSGIADQLKEMTEIQMEGGDVMMSTFSGLKSFSFFNNMANWFLPFDANHSEVSSIMDELESVGDILDNAPFLCDSDKYSFMLAVRSIPTDKRSMMLSQIKAQTDSVYEMINQMGTDDDSAETRRRTLNSYMQNIYRFFKLFYRKNEFFDPFDCSVNLITVPSLAVDFTDPELLQVVAEFYFKLKYMQDAIDVYTHLESIATGDAPRYQKMGYCYEHLSQPDKAIEYYHRAELLDSDSHWTLRRLATCYRQMGDNAAALDCYRRLADADPDNQSAAMLYGRSLLENGMYTEALNQFYKVEFMDEHSTRALRPLAWTLFVTGDLRGAKAYYERILNDEPTATDYLNYGHVALASGDMALAIKLYGMAVSDFDNDSAWLSQAIEADKDALIRAGVDPLILPLVADASRN